MDYLIMMSGKYLFFRKSKKHLARTFSPALRSNWIHVLRKYFSNCVILKDMYKILKEI